MVPLAQELHLVRAGIPARLVLAPAVERRFLRVAHPLRATIGTGLLKSAGPEVTVGPNVNAAIGTLLTLVLGLAIVTAFSFWGL